MRPYFYIRICIHYTFIMAIIAIYNSLLIKYANQIVQEAEEMAMHNTALKHIVNPSCVV